MNVRPERAIDHREVETVTREAFWNLHWPGCDEHYLLHVLRTCEAFVPELNLVAEVDGKIVGNIVYTKAKIACDDGIEREALSFGPVSVLPEYWGMGIGSELIRHTLELAKAAGHKRVLIYGDPAYYYRFGFVPAEKFGIATADNMYLESLQALELLDGALEGCSGRFFEDAVYDVDPNAAASFDKTFPAKELRDDVPSQKRFRDLVRMRRPR